MADMGTLQRLPSIVGHGIAAELALTARSFSGGPPASGLRALWAGCGAVALPSRAARRSLSRFNLPCWPPPLPLPPLDV